MQYGHFFLNYQYVIILEDIEQLLQPDNPIVTLCATRFARLRTNRANYGLQVKQMLRRQPLPREIYVIGLNNE